jgi:hypothetical protein
MRTVKILFFSADPESAYGGRQRLLLDEDMRQIQQKVRAAEYRDALDFDFRLATRTDDLLQALNETRPQVVHFSGHGHKEGLVLVSADGRRPHLVQEEVLKQVFEVFRGDIRVVVLSACLSLPQAEAIADVVGCAIGTRAEISDDAAITFNAAFYRAIAFGHSVQAAYDQAHLALRLEHFDEAEYPTLVVGSGIDPVALVLVGDSAEPEVRDTGSAEDGGEPSTHSGPSFKPCMDCEGVGLQPKIVGWNATGGIARYSAEPEEECTTCRGTGKVPSSMRKGLFGLRNLVDCWNCGRKGIPYNDYHTHCPGCGADLSPAS